MKFYLFIEDFPTVYSICAAWSFRWWLQLQWKRFFTASCI